MDILELILSRRTVHSYTTEPVSRSVIEDAVLAAIHAPNHKHTWPWRFFLAGPKTREKLAHLQVEFKSKAKGEMSDAMRTTMIEQFMKPAALLVLAYRKSGDVNQEREDYAAVACAVQNMSLYLAGQGIGSKWSTGKVTQSEKTYEILGLSPSEIQLCGWFWVGHPEAVPRKPERPAIDQFLKDLE